MGPLSLGSIRIAVSEKWLASLRSRSTYILWGPPRPLPKSAVTSANPRSAESSTVSATHNMYLMPGCSNILIVTHVRRAPTSAAVVGFSASSQAHKDAGFIISGSFIISQFHKETSLTSLHICHDLAILYAYECANNLMITQFNKTSNVDQCSFTTWIMTSGYLCCCLVTDF